MNATQLSPWRIEDHSARLDAPSFTLVVNLRDPAAGVDVRKPEHPSTDLGLRMLGVQIPPVTDGAGLEFFARGNDLVATYPETAARLQGVQAYWRWLPNSALSGSSDPTKVIAALELILSVQTSLLDSDPTQTVQSMVPRALAYQLLDPSAKRLTGWIDRTPNTKAAVNVDSTAGTGCFAFNLIYWRMHYMEMVHPADFYRAALETIEHPRSAIQLTHQLFAQRLEKGVILRSRIRSVLATVSDPAALATAYEEFAASEPPLTA